MVQDVRFSVLPPGTKRVHHVTEQDVRVVLARLPVEVYSCLRAVHFNDQSLGNRTLGYVTRGSREITLCALPPRVSFTRHLVKGQTPEQFGARRGAQWPVLAIRRFLLYDVFLHELGHLQIVNDRRRSERLKFAREKLAQEFGMEWCRRMWSSPFEHPDPAHNPPSPEEIAGVNGAITNAP
jgi:hypothetical protein